MNDWPEFDGPTISARKVPPGQEAFVTVDDADRDTGVAFALGLALGSILTALGFLAVFLTFRWL